METEFETRKKSTNLWTHLSSFVRLEKAIINDLNPLTMSNSKQHRHFWLVELLLEIGNYLDDGCDSSRRREELSVIRLIKCVIKTWWTNFLLEMRTKKRKWSLANRSLIIRSVRLFQRRKKNLPMFLENSDSKQFKPCRISKVFDSVELQRRQKHLNNELPHIERSIKQTRWDCWQFSWLASVEWRKKKISCGYFFHLKNRSSLDILLSLSSYHLFVCL